MDKANEIRILFAMGGIMQKEIALIYGVHQSKISDAVCYKTWA